MSTTNELKNIYSPSHEFDISRKGRSEARLSLEEQDFDASTDLRLYYHTSSQTVGLNQLYYRPNGEDGYFMMQLSPGFVSDQASISAKDITFVVDASGSMSGEKWIKQKEQLNFASPIWIHKIVSM